MSLAKKIAALAAPVVGVVLTVGLPVSAFAGAEEAAMATPSAQTAQASSESATAPKPAATSKMSAVKHESGTATNAAKAAKSSTDLTTGAK